MKHWSIDIQELQKDRNAYTIWKLEQMINFGLGEGALQKKELLAYWEKLNLDPAKKKFLALLLGR